MKLITLDTEGRGALKHEQQPGYVGEKLWRFFELNRASWSGGCLSLVSTTGLDQTTERERLAMLFSVGFVFSSALPEGRTRVLLFDLHKGVWIL